MPPYVALVPLADIAPVVRSNERGRQLRRPQALDPTRKEVRVGPAYAVSRTSLCRNKSSCPTPFGKDEARHHNGQVQNLFLTQKVNSAAGVKTGQHLIDCTASVGGTRPRRCHIGSFTVRGCGSKQARTKPSIEAA